MWEQEALLYSINQDEETRQDSMELRNGKSDTLQVQKSVKPGQASEIRVIARSA